MRNKRGDTLVDRLWNGTPPGLPDTECWEWTSYRDTLQGYGRLFFAGKDLRAHRVAYALSRGAELPKGMVVRHTCDNPPCVNPNHLVLGTTAENVEDRVERGRGASVKGSHNGRAKLTEEDVRDMRAKHASGVSMYRLAKDYGLSGYVVRSAVNGKTWKHVV